MTDPIKRFVDVEVTKATNLVSVAGFGIPLFLTGDTTNLPTATRTQAFTTVAAVTAVFGASSPEEAAAAAFFNQSSLLTNQPERIIFGSYDSATETEEECIAACEESNSDWYCLSCVASLRDTADLQAFATAIESRRKMALFCSNDDSVLTLGDETTISYYLKNANYSRTAIIYCDNAALYPDASWLGQQLPKTIGTTNWAFKELYGFTALSLTESEIDAALDVNCNVYTETAGATFVYKGTMGGGRNADGDGEFIDIIRNADFLNARVQEGLMSLLLEKDIIPMTNGGITLTENRLKSLLDTYGVKQGILTEGSVVTYFPKRSEISASDRDDRLLPYGTFTAELTGGINKVVVRGTVSI